MNSNVAEPATIFRDDIADFTPSRVVLGHKESPMVAAVDVRRSPGRMPAFQAGPPLRTFDTKTPEKLGASRSCMAALEMVSNTAPSLSFKAASFSDNDSITKVSKFNT